MEWIDYIQYVGALVFVLALIAGLAVLLRRMGLAGAVAVTRPKKAGRRLSVIETLPLDGRRRLLLLRCDDHEHLVLLGQNQDLVLGAPVHPSRAAPRANGLPPDVALDSRTPQAPGSHADNHSQTPTGESR